MKTAIIIGAGPAGLTAAYELIKKTNIKPIILEATKNIGGISRNVYYKGNIIDLGGHRFFSKDKIVNEIWQEFMPLQGKPSNEEKITGYSTKLTPGGPDPEVDNNVLLMRTRLSRIYYLNKFFDYPLSVNFKTIANLGFSKTFKAGAAYIKSKLVKKKEISLENFYINRFGKYLYSVFFEKYTEKLWGRHPKDIDASWGRQRVKGLSLSKAVIHALTKPFRRDNQNVEGSLVGSFSYPKLGPGSLYEKMANWLTKNGAILMKESEVTKIIIKNNRITKIEINKKKTMSADYYFSSMPLSELFKAIGKKDVPNRIYNSATKLPYRDFITVNILLKKLKLKNSLKRKSINGRILDTWIYIQDASVKIGRIQVLNNWSPYLAKDNINTTWIGLEFFANENDEYWKMKDYDLINFAINEAETIGIFDKKDVVDATVCKVKKAYPAYFDTYSDIGMITNFIDRVDNLFCIGRNGQHRYNNMDHSMLTAIKAVECIRNEDISKSSVWKVNTSQEYHEK